MDDKIQDNPTSQHITDQQEVSGDEKVDDLETAAHLRQLTPEELVLEKKLRRKIDLRIMPIIVLIYLMNYIDR